MIKLDSCFELAFRRALFSLLLLIGYLLGGSLIFHILAQVDQANNEQKVKPIERQRLERLDFERSELLNVLWAEAIAARSESDWSVRANAKMDSYERLLSSTGSSHDKSPNKAKFSEAFKGAFLLLTTIGGGQFSDGDPEEMGTLTKLFAIVYATFGIPLTLIYLGQCVKAIKSLVESNSNGVWTTAVLIALGALIFTAIAMDVAEGNDDEDTSFVDALFSAFLVLSTIGGQGTQLEDFSQPLLYISCALLLGVFSCAFFAIQRQIELQIGGYEFAFAHNMGKIERVVSGAHLLDSVKEEEEVQDEITIEVPVTNHWRQTFTESDHEEDGDVHGEFTVKDNHLKV